MGNDKIQANYSIGDAIDCIDENLKLIRKTEDIDKPKKRLLFLISPQPSSNTNYEMTVITRAIKESKEFGKELYIVIVGDLTTGADGSRGLSMYLDIEPNIILVQRVLLELNRKNEFRTKIMMESYGEFFPSSPYLEFKSDLVIRELFVFKTVV